MVVIVYGLNNDDGLGNIQFSIKLKCSMNFNHDCCQYCGAHHIFIVISKG